jgi:radical SAM protein with 4Fe4S-binding SPASM domain
MRQHPVIAAPPAQLTLTADEFRPSGRGAGTSHQLRPGAGQHRHPYDWPTVHGEEVLADDSFFRLAPRGGPLPGRNLCGAGRVVCLIDPVGDVYACPFAIHEELLAAGVRQAGGFEKVWTDAGLFAELRRPQSGGACSACGFFGSCRGGCMAAKFFTGAPLDGPDPECVQGHVEALTVADPAAPPGHCHSHRGPARARAAVGRQPGGQRRPAPVPVTIGRPPAWAAGPGRRRPGPRRESAGWLRIHVAQDAGGQEPASGRTGLIRSAR